MAPQDRGVSDAPPAGLTDDALHAVTAQRERILAKLQAQTGCSRQEAEDLLSEATLNVLRRGAAEGVADWVHYFASAGRNARVTQWRRQRARETQAARAPRPTWLAGAGGDDTAEVVLARARAEDALDTLASLPPTERDVFVLREQEGLKPREVRIRLGLTAREERYRYERATRLLEESGPRGAPTSRRRAPPRCCC